MPQQELTVSCAQYFSQKVRPCTSVAFNAVTTNCVHNGASCRSLPCWHRLATRLQRSLRTSSAQARMRGGASQPEAVLAHMPSQKGVWKRVHEVQGGERCLTCT